MPTATGRNPLIALRRRAWLAAFLQTEWLVGEQE
jgi:hypothetical protein